ncbi:hypothetical protein BKA69DRAFT_1086420 [Paraphysoderma sedebokerense]|nr:hypothetical protein BKA69DRAFT_1086420 [Paraphysoderma sedebokerense]
MYYTSRNGKKQIGHHCDRCECQQFGIGVHQLLPARHHRRITSDKSDHRRPNDLHIWDWFWTLFCRSCSL